MPTTLNTKITTKIPLSEIPNSKGNLFLREVLQNAAIFEKIQLEGTLLCYNHIPEDVQKQVDLSMYLLVGILEKEFHLKNEITGSMSLQKAISIWELLSSFRESPKSLSESITELDSNLRTLFRAKTEIKEEQLFFLISQKIEELKSIEIQADCSFKLCFKLGKYIPPISIRIQLEEKIDLGEPYLKIKILNGPSKLLMPLLSRLLKDIEYQEGIIQIHLHNLVLDTLNSNQLELFQRTILHLSSTPNNLKIESKTILN